MSSQEGPKHGDYNTYVNHGCRCDLCKAALAAYTKEARARRKAKLEASEEEAAA